MKILSHSAKKKNMFDDKQKIKSLRLVFDFSNFEKIIIILFSRLSQTFHFDKHQTMKVSEVVLGKGTSQSDL